MIGATTVQRSDTIARVSRGAIGAIVLGAIMTVAGNDAVARRGAPGPGVVALSTAWRPLAYPATRSCGIVRSSDWSASMITNRAGGRYVTVRGMVSTKPTTALALRFDPGRRTISIRNQQPREPTPDIAAARVLAGRWPIARSSGAIRVRCGPTTLATIRLAS